VRKIKEVLRLKFEVVHLPVHSRGSTRARPLSAPQGQPTDYLKRRRRERICSLEGINLVVRAFKKEIQNHNRRLPITGNSDASDRKINPPEPLEGSGGLAEPELT
jgi:hypothetical protein